MNLLEGIRILDLSRLLPGPYGTMLLADLGAEVIKIETPGFGDYLRLIPPFVQDPATGKDISARFLIVNRNKKSVGVNYRNPRGKEIFMRLARDADVILESFRPGAVKKWGIDYDAVRAVNPKIIYCSLSGYGQSGPYRDRAGHDLNYIALTGLLAANGRRDGTPYPPAVQIADLSGGMMAAIAILAALIGRGKSGEGQYLDLSLFESALSWTATLLGPEIVAGKKIAPGKLQLNGGMASYNVYETRDGKFITIGAIEPHFWQAFCNAVGREDLIPRGQDFDAVPVVAEIFKTRTLDEWLAQFEKIDACIEPVRDYSEVLENAQVRHRGLIASLPLFTSPLIGGTEGGGKIPQVGSVFVFAKNKNAPAPRLGEHTRGELKRLEIGEEELEELEKAGVIESGGFGEIGG